MKQRLFGKTGLRVSELCLGTMTFGEEWGWGSNKDISKQVFNTYVDAGGNFIDTANLYTGGTSEEMVGEFVKGKRQEFVLATKYTFNMNPKNANGGGNHRKTLVENVEASLKRMQTDYLDILWVHAWDHLTPTAETMRALDDLIRQGKILYIGISDAPAWWITKANTLSELKGWSEFAGLQIEYNLLERTVERELLPMAKDQNLCVTTWGPLGGGVLTGKYNGKNLEDERRHKEGPWAEKYLQQKNLDIAGMVVNFAKELGKSPSQVAINWIRSKTENNIVPILGARKVEQLKDNLGCLDFTLPNEIITKLDEATQIELGFPHDFLIGVQEMIHGEFDIY